MYTFILYWQGGKTEVISGDSISQAFANAGYGGGALRALDFYSVGENYTHVWDADRKGWVPLT